MESREVKIVNHDGGRTTYINGMEVPAGITPAQVIAVLETADIDFAAEEFDDYDYAGVEELREDDDLFDQHP